MQVLTVLLLGFLGVGQAQANKVPSYLEHAFKQGKIIELLNSAWYRRYFGGAGVLSVGATGHFLKFIEQNMPEDMRKLVEELNQYRNVNDIPEDKREDIARNSAEIENMSEKLRLQWLHKFYPPLKNEELLTKLSEDSQLRALVVSHLFWLRHMETELEEAKEKLGEKIDMENALRNIPIEHVFNVINNLAVFFAALDRDIDVEGLGEVLVQAGIENTDGRNKLEVSYVQEETDFEVPGVTLGHYTSLVEYLRRINSVRRGMPLNEEQEEILRLRGFSEVIDRIPAHVADQLIRAGVIAEEEDGQLKTISLDPIIVIDALSEWGIVANHPLTPFLLSEHYLLAALNEEMGLNLNLEEVEEKLATMVADILNDKDNLASLFQVTELARHGFALAEIRAMSYDTRDAIIISQYQEREDFFAQHGDDIKALNELVEETGPLVFHLLDSGFSRAEINQHRVPTEEELITELREIREWQKILGQ